MYLLFGVTARPWGMCADRWGAVPFLGLFYLGAGISGLCAAFWIDSPLGLTLSLAAIGLFSGIYHPAGLGWISTEISRISLAMGYNGMSGNLGLATAPLVAGWINWVWGLQGVYIVLGCMNLLGLLFMLVFRVSGKHERPASADAGTHESGRSFLILLVAMMLGGVVYRGATLIFPPCFELKNKEIFDWFTSLSGSGFSPNLVANISVSLLYIVGMAGQYTGGRMAEQFELRKCYFFFHLLTIPVAFLMYSATDLPLLGLAMFWGCNPSKTPWWPDIPPRNCAMQPTVPNSF